MAAVMGWWMGRDGTLGGLANQRRRAPASIAADILAIFMPQPAADEHELKFAIDWSLAPAMEAVLSGLFRPDPDFPDNVVASLYFDTAEFSCLADCRDGILVKNKLRLRWYEREFGVPDGGSSVLEVKRRFGSRRRKERWVTAIEGPWLAALPASLPSSLARWDEAVDEPVGSGMPRGAMAQALPALVVRYRRRRFVDPASGSRLSLDTAIRPCAIRQGFPVGGLGVPLRSAVVEVKNHAGVPPPALAPFLGRLTRGISFSKYERCFAAALGRVA